MMMSGIRITGDVQAFSKFLTAGSTLKIIESEIKKATIKAALFLIKQVKNKIRNQKGLRKNAPLTLALNRGELTLLKEKNLFDALGFNLKDAFEAEVGILKGKKSTGGASGKSTDLQAIVFRLHKGFEIDVTPEVRAAIIFGLRQSRSDSSKEALEKFDSNTGKGKSKFVVKPIKFLSAVFKNEANRQVVVRIYKKALETAFKKAGAKGGDEKFKGSVR